VLGGLDDSPTQDSAEALRLLLQVAVEVHVPIRYVCIVHVPAYRVISGLGQEPVSPSHLTPLILHDTTTFEQNGAIPRISHLSRGR
jgi:hypothetical protein